jgi:hypothetical protein
MAIIRPIPGGPGGPDGNLMQRVAEARAAKRAKMATQSWRDFFRGWAIEVGAIAIIVIIVAIVIGFVRGWQ